MSFYELFFGFGPDIRARHPDVFADSNIDRRKCSRVVPMQVLSLGFGRTGTASMQAALQLLGYPTYHGYDVLSNVEDCDMWLEAFERKYRNADGPALDRSFWDRLLGHVAATTDWPCNAFWRELIESYPDAKIVLVERDVDQWCPYPKTSPRFDETFGGSDRSVLDPSFRETTIDPVDSLVVEIAARLDRKYTGRLLTMAKQGTMEGQFGAKNLAEWRANAKDVYRKHYADIRAFVKERGEEHRFLEYQLGSGWQPLCAHLGKELPTAEFPNINERQYNQEKTKVTIMRMVQKASWLAFTRVIPAFAVACLGLYLANIRRLW